LALDDKISRKTHVQVRRKIGSEKNLAATIEKTKGTQRMEKKDEIQI
jgi:hypothetical protein